ncbi:MAG: RecX family transcriptional regulator [Candidatus Gracilibacteria bacterium]|nr:RecX family transcriptional regulator [Candidatus Gracilibacteria bacterium]
MKYIPNYTDPKILKNYAIWYYNRYFPSISKIRKKLISKNGDGDLVDRIMNELGNIFKEEDIITDIIKNQIYRGKTIRYMRQNLLAKEFSKELIDKLIKEYSDSDEIDANQSRTIRNKIEFLKDTKSKRIILQNLMNSGYSKDLIEDIMNEIEFNEENLLGKEIEKIRKTGVSKEKMIKKLLGKGFKYEDIRNDI